MVAPKIPAIGLIILVAGVYAPYTGFHDTETPLHEPSDIWNMSGDDPIECTDEISTQEEGEKCGPNSPSIRFKRANKKVKEVHLHLAYKCCKKFSMATMVVRANLVCGRNHNHDPYICQKSPVRGPGNVNLPQAQHHQHPQHRHPHQAKKQMIQTSDD